MFKRHFVKRQIVFIPIGLVLDCAAVLGRYEQPGTKLPAEIALSTDIIEAVANELRLCGYRGEQLASELGRMIEVTDESKSDD